MFIPIGDDNQDRRLTPIVNYFFIFLNIFVFIYFQNWGQDLQFTYAFATVPGEIISGHDIITQGQILQDPNTGQIVQFPGLQPTPVPVFLTLLSSMFMHGGIAHILGNMLFLWIAGDNVEDAMGHTNYFFFYLICGILSGLSHVFVTYYFSQDLLTPSLGASGAIAGILGAYIFLFPRKRVYIWLFFWFTIAVPAWIAVGLWFAFQVIDGLGMLGGRNSGNIAYGAHIGGFIAGLLLCKLFVQKRQDLPGKTKSFW